MAKYVKKTLSWNPGPDPDIVAHRVYVNFGTDQPDYDSISVVVDMPGSDVELPFQGMPLGDGTYSFGVSAIDDFGNESDMAFVSAELDFLAPSPPSGLEIS